MLEVHAYFSYCKLLKGFESKYGLVRKVIVEYRIPSLKKKEACIDIRRLVFCQIFHFRQDLK